MERVQSLGFRSSRATCPVGRAPSPARADGLGVPPGSAEPETEHPISPVSHVSAVQVPTRPLCGPRWTRCVASARGSCRAIHAESIVDPARLTFPIDVDQESPIVPFLSRSSARSSSVLFRMEEGERFFVLMVSLLVAGVALGGPVEPGNRFIRGDTNQDGCVDARDGDFLLLLLNDPDQGFKCREAADANDDGEVNLADAVFILNFAENGGFPPPLPFPECGFARGESLGCESYLDDACSGCVEPEILLVRGDSNQDGDLDVSDAIFALNYLFVGGAEPPCLAAADVNGTGFVDLSDSIYLLSFIFIGGPPPPVPYPECGVDESELECGRSTCL